MRAIPDVTLTTRPSPLARRDGERGARQQDRRNEIDFDHRPNFGLGRILQAAGPDAAGVVDKDIEAAKFLQTRLERCGATVTSRDIRGEAKSLGVRCAKLIDGLGDKIRSSSSDEHLRAGGGHRLRRCKADAA